MYIAINVRYDYYYLSLMPPIDFVYISKFTSLFFAAFLSMFIFQLVTRLTEYVFMFHQGVLLLSSALVGASLALVGVLFLPQAYKAYYLKLLPLLVMGSWLVYLVIFVTTQSLVIHFVILTILFGALFLLITQNIHLPPNQFTAVELLGSFIGAAGLVLLSFFLLEEWLIIGAVLGIGLYILYTKAWQQAWPIVNVSLGGLVVCTVYIFSTFSLPELITCPDRSQTYKIACIDTNDTFTLTSSVANISGRSDVFINTGSDSPRLSVYNSGLHSGTSLVREAYTNLSQQYHDVEIPPLAYAPGSKVAAAGASTGSNVLTFQSYISYPDITVVEIDTIISDLYQEESYINFLPEVGSFALVYQDARTFFETRDTKFDVISMMVESVNTTLAPFVDESTSLVYTTEALRTYVDALDTDGYLLLQQFHISGELGDAMIHKVLGSLEAALDPAAAAALQENIILYSYAFSAAPDAQRFLGAIYKPDGFSVADTEQFTTWIDKNNTRASVTSGARITVLHTPDGTQTYDLFFSDNKRATLAAFSNTSIITDDKPFRHLVTTLPFPRQYYLLILLSVGLLTLLLAAYSKRAVEQSSQLPVAFGIGLITFGLQYVLYYKTAAFIGTSLIYFSVFLLIPLFFGALGGYFSYKLRQWHAVSLVVMSSVVAGYLLFSATLSLSPIIVFLLLTVLFVFSGMVFPLLLSQATTSEDRLLMYASNMGGGGAATIMVISLHAVIGWVYLFSILFGILMLSFIYLFYLFSKR
jgi:hypothetical protein